MSSLFSRLNSAAPAIEAMPAQTLDQLWHEAEQLGEIEVDHALGESGTYRVRISFQRRSGSRIWAEAKDANIAFAMAKAINEARDLGAGRTS